ncbi:hypothetical protein DF19_11420 [Streptomyces olindensis]|nr:hypothetical protein DF19_11420 [Streptomyces olindensis]
MNWWLFGALLLLVTLAALRAALVPGGSTAAGDSAPVMGSDGRSDGPKTLPPGAAVFAGRDNELDRLLTAEPPATATRPLVCLVTGRSGSGKTELAVQAAHRLGERYPGGRLFVGYRSNTGSAGHLRPEDVLAAVLVTVGAAPATTDFDLDSMTTQWRTAVGDRPFLMVAEPTPPALRAEPHRPDQRDGPAARRGSGRRLPQAARPSQRGILRRRSRHEPLPPGRLPDGPRQDAAGRRPPPGPGPVARRGQRARSARDDQQGHRRLRGGAGQALRGLRIYQEQGNQRNEAWILIELGTIDRLTGDHDSAEDRFRAALRINSVASDRNGRAWARREIGIVRRIQGRHTEARDLLEEALEEFRSLHSERNIADVLVELCTLHRVKGEHGAARERGVAALHKYQELGNLRGAAWAEVELGVVDARTGEPTSAADRFERARTT